MTKKQFLDGLSYRHIDAEIRHINWPEGHGRAGPVAGEGGDAMSTYYAVCHVGGPISVRLGAESDEDARLTFEAGDHRAWIDTPRLDAEDDLNLDIDDPASATEAEYGDALERAGCCQVCDLARIENYHAGTVAHLAGGWVLWRVT